jgi:hypothetical protein
MTVRATILGSATAFAISALAFLFAIEQITGAAADEVPLGPLIAGGYAAIVGTGLLIGSGLLRARIAQP